MTTPDYKALYADVNTRDRRLRCLCLEVTSIAGSALGQRSPRKIQEQLQSIDPALWEAYDKVGTFCDKLVGVLAVAANLAGLLRHVSLMNELVIEQADGIQTALRAFADAQKCSYPAGLRAGLR